MDWITLISLLIHEVLSFFITYSENSKLLVNSHMFVHTYFHDVHISCNLCGKKVKYHIIARPSIEDS